MVIKILSILALIFIAIMVSCQFGFSLISYDQIQDSSYEFVSGLGNNWGTKPISSIITGNDCEEDKSLINQKWPGTAPGCKCYSITRGLCNRNGKSYKRTCNDVLPMSPTSFLYWDGVKLCRKSYNNTYLDLNVIQTCPINSIDCGVVDSLNNKLCVSNSDECPVNDIKFVSLNTDTPNDYYGINLKTSKVIYSTKQTPKNIPIDLRIEDEQPCADPSESNSKSSKFVLDFYYGNSQCLNQVSGNVFNPDYVKLSSSNYADVLKENNIFTRLISFPDYPVNQLDHVSFLYSRGYIGLKPECKPKLLKSINNDVIGFVDSLVRIGQYSEKAVAVGKTTRILTIISFSMSMFMTIINFLKILCYLKQSNFKKSCYNVVFWNLLTIVSVLVSMGFFASFSSSLSSVGNAHNLLVGCLDPQAETLLGNFSLKITSVTALTTAGSILGGLTSLLMIVELVLWRMLVKTEVQDSTDQASNSVALNTPS